MSDVIWHFVDLKSMSELHLVLTVFMEMVDPVGDSSCMAM